MTETSQLREQLLETLALKDVPRRGWLRAGIAQPESVAAHSWGVAWLVMVLCPSSLNRERALMMALVHDLAEVRVGDITPHDNVSRADKQQREQQALAQMTAPLPGGAAFRALFDAYEQGTDAEARLVKACDKLDMALQAQRYAKTGADTEEFVRSALQRITDPELRALVSHVEP